MGFQKKICGWPSGVLNVLDASASGLNERNKAIMEITKDDVSIFYQFESTPINWKRSRRLFVFGQVLLVI